jgi:hypothetical protein
MNCEYGNIWTEIDKNHFEGIREDDEIFPVLPVLRQGPGSLG